MGEQHCKNTDEETVDLKVVAEILRYIRTHAELPARVIYRNLSEKYNKTTIRRAVRHLSEQI